MYTKVKTAEEIAYMRISGQILAKVLDAMKKNVAVGMTTQDMADIAHRELKKLGGKPAFLGYEGFPSVICISVNDEIVHGIPKDLVINDGDIVSFDFGVNYQGMITDAAFSMVVGQSNPEKDKLLNVTYESMMAGINAIKGQTVIGDIAEPIQTVIEKAGFGVVRDLVGHGVGHEVHEDPNIPNFGKKGEGDILQPGMTICIEPMATVGDWHVTIDSDRWTIRTADRSLAAHFEHTVLITENGAEILTKI